MNINSGKLGAFSWLEEWVETTKAEDFALKSNVQIAQEQPSEGRMCGGCRAVMMPKEMQLQTDAGRMADGEYNPDMCAHCFAEFLIRDSAKYAEMDGEVIAALIKEHRYEN